MNILRKTLTFIIIAAGIIGCEKEEQEIYYSVLGMLEVSDDSTYINSDGGEKIYVNNVIGSYLKDGHRVVAIFTKVDEELPTGVDLIVDVVDIDTVLFKEIIELTPEISDSLGNDPVSIDDIWIAKDFMNINFTFVGGNSKHIINLAHDTTFMDTVSLEIRHNDNDDNGAYKLGSFVTFDLTKAQSTTTDSVILKITAQDFYNETFEEYITYRY
jgi:hypothetical protein